MNVKNVSIMEVLSTADEYRQLAVDPLCTSDQTWKYEELLQSLDEVFFFQKIQHMYITYWNN